MERALKKKIQDWVANVGRDVALQKLLAERLSLSTAQKLVCKSGYQYEPSGVMIGAIERAMAS